MSTEIVCEIEGIGLIRFSTGDTAKELGTGTARVRMRRRAFLASVGTMASASMSAGCISSLQETINPSVQLVWFGVHNADIMSSHRFDMEVIRDGTEVHSSTHVVDAAERLPNGRSNDGAVAKCSWGNTAGDYTVRIRADDNEWEEKSITKFAKANDADSVAADAQYTHDTTSLELVKRWRQNGYKRLCSFATD